MSSYDQACDTLTVLKDLSRTLISTCEDDPILKTLPIKRDLVAFRDAVWDVLIQLYDAKYRSRRDTDRFNADLYIIANSASSDFDVLQPIISRSASPSYSPSSVHRQRLLDLGDRIYNHSKDLHKILDQIVGREDWSELSPKPPSTPTQKSKDYLRTTKKVTFTPSTGSSSGRSARSSPSSLQPTVEDATDLGEDEENHGVSSYHLNPRDFDKGSSSRPSSDEKSSPPRVVVRQATDPNQLEPVIKKLSFDDPPDNSVKGLNMFTTTESTHSPTEQSTRDRQYSVIGSSSRPRGSDELYEEIRKREDELRKLREELHSSSSDSSWSPQDHKGKQPLFNRDDDPFGVKAPPNSQSSEEKPKLNSSFYSSSSSNYHSAHSKAPSFDYGKLSNSSASSLKVPDATSRPRQRAATMSSTESGRKPDLGVDLGGNVSRPPYLSPRYSPYASSSEYSSPRVRTGGFDAFHGQNNNSSKESIYGTPHNTSLPTVLEHGTQRGTPDREKKRSSWYEGGDFALFDTSDPPSTQNLFKSTTAAPATSASSAAAAAAAAANAEVAPGTITQELPVSLSDLLNGTKKRVKVQRLLLDSMSGELHTFTEVLDVQVYAGLRPGSRVTLAGRGDWIPALQRFGDLVFLLVEKRHDTYERDGRDLVMRVELSLYESLCGWSRTVETLCGRKLQVSPARPTPAGETLSVGPYGMPKFVGKDLPPGPRGELLLKVEVRWPSGGFDSRQRALLRQALVEGGRSPRR